MNEQDFRCKLLRSWFNSLLGDVGATYSPECRPTHQMILLIREAPLPNLGKFNGPRRAQDGAGLS